MLDQAGIGLFQRAPEQGRVIRERQQHAGRPGVDDEADPLAGKPAQPVAQFQLGACEARRRDVGRGHRRGNVEQNHDADGVVASGRGVLAGGCFQRQTRPGGGGGQQQPGQAVGRRAPGRAAFTGRGGDRPGQKMGVGIAGQTLPAATRQHPEQQGL